MKQKLICKKIRSKKICRNKYKEMYTIKHKLYYRDDKPCYENMHGINVPKSPNYSKKNCGWYLNDKTKVSNDFNYLKPENYVWRKNSKRRHITYDI